MKNYDSLITFNHFSRLFIVNILSGIAKNIVNESRNRKSDPSFLHRDANLTTVYGPKYLCENSTNQLRNCNAPGECKAKNKPRKAALKWERRVFP